MSDKRPADMVVALRQIAAGVASHNFNEWPKWFLELNKKEGPNSWPIILNQAADELESMQKLNGRLYKTLYGD